MRKLMVTAFALAMLIPLGGCADENGYSTGYYDPYTGGGYYAADNDATPYHQHQYYYNNGYNWPY